ncbi:cytochrome b/b6 domain-containing protein [Ancylobacter terrae]|uniref:cytochrome b/b6 domain-containing protein n=1 Tax=Ancylobacter sp. sgz301288 TaxID=3342077 RepID=UPI00385ECA4E
MSERTLSPGAIADGGRSDTVLAWDLPTRLAKWALVVLVGCAFLSKYYGDVGLVWHMWNGLAILVVVVFRLLWGLVGGSTARFAGFLRGPGAILAYVRGLASGRAPRFLGHNPAGGWVVVALLVLVGAQATSGLFLTDDIIVEAPLSTVVSGAVVRWAGWLHHNIYRVLLALIAVHVAANLAYSAFGKDNLILAMLSGRKRGGGYVDHGAARPGPVLLALACLAVAAGVVFGGIALAGGDPFP